MEYLQRLKSPPTEVQKLRLRASTSSSTWHCTTELVLPNSDRLAFRALYSESVARRKKRGGYEYILFAKPVTLETKQAFKQQIEIDLEDIAPQWVAGHGYRLRAPKNKREVWSVSYGTISMGLALLRGPWYPAYRQACLFAGDTRENHGVDTLLPAVATAATQPAAATISANPAQPGDVAEVTGEVSTPPQVTEAQIESLVQGSDICSSLKRLIGVDEPGSGSPMKRQPNFAEIGR